MLPITLLLSEGARVTVCFVLCALTFFCVGLSTLYLIVVRLLSSSVSAYTSLVEGYNGDHLMFVLTCLASAAILSNLIGCYNSFVSMYPERRAGRQLSLFMVMLVQLCLVVAFACFSILCYIYAKHVDDSFKVSGCAVYGDRPIPDDPRKRYYLTFGWLGGVVV